MNPLSLLSFLSELSVKFGWGWVGYPILLLIIIYFLMNPEKAEKWGALLSKLLAYFSIRAEKRHIGLDIQSIVNNFKKSIDKEVEGLLPYGIKIDWVGEDITPESFFSEGKIIIRLGHHKNRDENIIRVLSEYITQSLVREIKHHLADDVKKAIDFTFMKKILKEIPSALNRFFETRYKPAIEETPSIQEHCRMMDDLDANGWFTRIFLRELKEIGVELEGRFPNEEVNREVMDFLRFLHRISTKKQDEDVPLLFCGKKIKTSVVLVARPETDLIRHELRIQENILKGVKSFYLAARGSNVGLVKDLVKTLDKLSNIMRFDEIKTYKTDFGDKKVSSICVRYVVINTANPSNPR